MARSIPRAAARGPKIGVDPWRPIDVLSEEERLVAGGRAPAVTVFLAGAECPFDCVFCDLWRFTLDGPTPPGAIPAQLAMALESVGEVPEGATIKLYNASNFFDRRAVPPEDDADIARLLAPFARVVVECHPRLVGRRALELAARLEGRLQVAMGLETVHPEALPRLDKRLTLEGFQRAVATLARHGVELRVFVLVGAPFVPAAEAVRWAVRSARFAREQGAVHVTLIPVRGGAGEMARLERQGLFTPPTLAQLETALMRCLDELDGDDCVVTVDTWDLDRFAVCATCRAARVERLARVNLTGRAEPDIVCDECGHPEG